MTNLRKTRLSQAIREAQLNPGRPVSRLGVSFYCRLAKGGRKHVTSRVYLQLYYRGRIKRISTGIRAPYGALDHETRIVHGDEKATEFLQMIYTKAYQIYEQLLLTEQAVRIELICEALFGIVFNDPHSVSIKLVIDQYLDRQQTRREVGEIEKGTFELWQRHLRFFLDYLKAQKRQEGMIDEVKPSDATGFLLWLKSSRKSSHNYALKAVSNVKAMLNFAIEHKWIEHNPFLNFRGRKAFKKGEMLTENEVRQIADFELFAKPLELIRDIFLFQTFTGLSYVDVKTLQLSDILLTADGDRYIHKDRKKTSVRSVIPLIPDAEYILAKYRDNDFCKRHNVLLPVISNQKMNNYLKQLAGMIGISKRLTTHVARRTCATIFINNGVPVPTVSAILGHSHSKITEQIYTDYRPETVIRDLNAYLQRKGSGGQFFNNSSQEMKPGRERGAA